MDVPAGEETGSRGAMRRSWQRDLARLADGTVSRVEPRRENCFLSGLRIVSVRIVTPEESLDLVPRRAGGAP